MSVHVTTNNGKVVPYMDTAEYSINFSVDDGTLFLVRVSRDSPGMAIRTYHFKAYAPRCWRTVEVV